MRVRLLTSVLALCFVPLLAQTQPPTQPHANALGFSYSLPSDWEIVDAAPAMPAAKQQAKQTAGSEDEKKGIACAEVALTARHGNPPSVIVVVALPFGCYGQTMIAKDLPGFGAGAAEGLKQNFNVADTVYGSYTLGSHGFWIERAKGSAKNNPKSEETIEIACSVLHRAAVCWMTMAADADGLRSFEDGLVTLDGEPATPLVPAGAFAQKPS
ncbi:MAG: hypothetical protein ACRD3N_15520 [Terracidiphilus sp.]